MSSKDYQKLLKEAILSFEKANKKIKQLENEKNEPIAIVGTSCRLPGNVFDINDLGVLLENKIDAICPIPRNRWDYSRMEDNSEYYTMEGGILEDINAFDANFFNVQQEEADMMDPQQRILLELAWEAFENANILPKDLRKKQIGVFIGISSIENFSNISKKLDENEINKYSGLGNLSSTASGRIAHYFGLTGPCMSIDTACSSSLTAIHQACQSLRNGESNMVLTGGVNLINSPLPMIALSNGGLLSPDSRCYSFSSKANGYVRSEGAGFIVLKRLSDAERDGDTILAKIVGSAINHNGVSRGLIIPNATSQATVIKQALKNANLSPKQISYIEAQGTGTPISDIFEIKVLQKVFFRERGKENPLTFGSIKTNIGNLEIASGIAGILKLIIQLKNKKIYPNLHFDTPNVNLDFDKFPIKILKETSNWEHNEGKRIAGVSSFALNGSNAHIIVEEYIPNKVENNISFQKKTPKLFVFSAKTKQSLNNYTDKLINYLNKFDDNENLESISYTLQVYRESMEERFAIIANSIDDLRKKMQIYEGKNILAENIFYGNTKKSEFTFSLNGKSKENFIDNVIADKKLDIIAQLWVSGHQIDWTRLYNNYIPKKITLPTYSFDHKRYSPFFNSVIDSVTSEKKAKKFEKYSSKKVDLEKLEENDISLNKKEETQEKFVELNKIDSRIKSVIDDYLPKEMKQKKNALISLIENTLNVSIYDLHSDTSLFEFESLKLLKIIRSVNSLFDINLELEEVFFVNKFSDFLDLLKVKLTDSKYVNNNKSSIDTKLLNSNYNLTENQKGLFYIQELEKTNISYNIPIAFTIFNNICKSDIEKAFFILKENFPILRTNFLINDKEKGEIVQKIIANSNSDFSYKKTKSNQTILLNEFQKLLKEPFDLGSKDLIRLHVRHNEEETHVLFVIHHIIFDGLSAPVLINFFVKALQDISNNKEVPLKKELGFLDFLQWEQDYLSTSDSKKSLEYWRERLINKNLNTNLPYSIQKKTDFLDKDNSIKFEEINLIENLKEIREIAVLLETPLSIFILAIFNLLLSKLSGSNEISIITPIARRPKENYEKSIGYFVNQIILNFSFDSSVPFKQMLYNIKKDFIMGIKHGDYPFSRLLPLLGLSTPEKRNSVSKLSYNYQSFNGKFSHSCSSDKGKDTISIWENIFQETEHDYAIEVYDLGEKIKIGIKYNSCFFSKETIKNHLRYFQNLLNEILVTQDKEISYYKLISNNEELKGQSQSFTNVNSKYETILDLFEEQVRENPDKIAGVFKDNSMTYIELDTRSNQLARYLRNQGVKPDTLVGICLKPGLEMLVGILAILKSGAGYVPIDAQLPKSRIEYIINDSNIDLVLSTEVEAKVLIGEKSLKLFLMDKDWDTIIHLSAKRLLNILSKHHLAYVIYTSGTSGYPKGVMIEHKSLIDYFWGITENTNITSCNSFGLVSTFSADLGNTVIYGSLLTGGTLHIFPPNELTSVKKISKYNIDCLKIVPSHWKALQQQGTFFIPNLCLIFGGELLTPDVVQPLFISEHNCNVYNHYGPTETTIGKLIKKVNVSEKFDKSIPLGKPFGDTKMYVLDIHNNICPVNEIGELCISGKGVARGYLNNVNLTNEKFVENPFLKNNFKMYLTGDLVRKLDNGEIEYIGRKDDQVKVRGYRVELKEIEKELMSFVEVLNCCVTLNTDSNSNKNLVAYVVLKNKLDKEVLQKKIAKSLPEYMIPRIWLALDQLPLTRNGKVDKSKLPEIDKSSLSSQSFSKASNDTEKSLVKIWKELLKLDKVGVNDNFFELGGHSLLIIKLISKLQHLGYEVTAQDVFNSPTISLLSEKLLKVTSTNDVPENCIPAFCNSITPSMLPLINLTKKELEIIMASVLGGVSNIQDIYPLSPLQEGIYLHHQLSDSSTGDPYIMPTILRFSSIDKRSEFIEGIRFLLKRHDVLRTCVLSKDLHKPVQVVLRDVELSIKVISIDINKEFLPQVEKEIDSETLWMDLSKAPMLQIKTADDNQCKNYFLVLNSHHLMVDHVGFENFIAEINIFLSNENKQFSTPYLYRDFIWHATNNIKLKEAKIYFKNLFKEIDEPSYPFNLSNIFVNGSDTVLSYSSVLAGSLSDSIRSLSSSLKISPAVIFHAAYGLVISKCSNKDYVIFGSLFSGRSQVSKGAVSSLGAFINTLPVVLKLTGNISEYIAQTNRVLQRLLFFEQTSLSEIHKWSTIPTSIPLFSALLNYQHSTSKHLSKNLNKLGAEISSVKERTNYPFTLDIDDYGNDFELTVRLTNNNIEVTSIIAYMEEALAFLTNTSSDQLLPVNKMSILSEIEKNKLLNTFNRSLITQNKQKTIIDLFIEQVNKTPKSSAIIFKDKSLSYEDLNKQSNQLARYLIKKGVSSGDFVGICLQRNLDLIISIFAVLKSGAVYVPIDSNYPKARINYILNDASVNVLLTDETFYSSLNNKEEFSAILLDKSWNAISQYPNINLNNKFLKNQLAYAIYTSGSTGKPKGVCITHNNLISFLINITDVLEIKNLKRFLSVTTYTFDIFYLEIFAPLLLGAEVILLDNNSVKDPHMLKSSIVNYNPDFMQATPSTWGMLIDSGWDNKSEINILTGGEPIKESLKNALTSISANVWNLYGPTEATIWVSAQKLDFYKKVTIGKPLQNVKFYILDSFNNLMPIGVVGELCIGGNQVARGYLNRDELTKEKFIKNPFLDGERIYRTGDMARWLEDGTVDLIGRKDEQVKIRGHRIEIGEIESQLSLLTEVKECCVVTSEVSDDNIQLIGYIVPNKKFNKAKIQNKLREHLPEYMIPKLWFELDKMPLTSNGKIDKKAVLLSGKNDLFLESQIAPRTKIENELVMIWQDLLGIEKVGIYDNFFELGGNSLLAVKMINLIQKKIGFELGVKNLFEFTCIEQLGDYIQYLEIKEGNTNEIIFEQKI